MAGSGGQRLNVVKYGLAAGMLGAIVLLLAVSLGLVSQVSSPPGDAGAPPDPAPAGEPPPAGQPPGEGQGEPPGIDPPDSAPPPGIVGSLVTDTSLWAEPNLLHEAEQGFAGDDVRVMCSLTGEAVEFADGTVRDEWYAVVTPAAGADEPLFVPSALVEVDRSRVQGC